MNIFDVGGLTTTIAVIFTLILGTGIFFLINKIFNVLYFGFGAIITSFGICIILGAFIINFLVGIAGNIFGIVWLLIKLGAIIAAISAIGKFIYSKLNTKKE